MFKFSSVGNSLRLKTEVVIAAHHAALASRPSCPPAHVLGRVLASKEATLQAHQIRALLMALGQPPAKRGRGRPSGVDLLRAFLAASPDGCRVELQSL